jgi:catechol 2,3-dioxygenase-like lactoylglutathione lyase family enzyme
MDDNRPPGLASILHVALTVTNAESSADWYGRVLGFERAMTVPHAGGFGIVLHSPDQRVWVVLHHHDANDQQRFSETRTGLDHVCFQVESYDQLQVWRDWFSAQGVEHTPITYLDQFDMSALVFRDPDNLQLELITYGSDSPGDGAGHAGST